MAKVYLDQNVFDASMERLDFIFKTFPRIYVSFSGGKDSGVMLNLVLKYMREKGITEKVGVMILDNEANYSMSLDFMHKILQENLDLLDVYWCCMPITLPCTVSSYAVEWQCWGVGDEDIWIREMPKQSYIVNVNNHPFGDWFYPNINYDEFWDKFGEWYGGGEEVCCMIGIRADESLNRYRAIMNEEKGMKEGKIWTKKNGKTVYNCYPIYDWRTQDIWVANAKFSWDYNKLYDLFYMAGLSIGSMRVASPFMSESKSSLNMYRIIDPGVWSRLCARVAGANFIATYGKQLSYRNLELPPSHTWKSFTKFLLETLPKEVAQNFKERFVQSLKFWARVGRGLNEETIKGLEENKIAFRINGVTPHGGNNLRRVTISSPPDNCDFLKTEAGSVTSWKRFALVILKNDHTCKYLGLQPAKWYMERQREIMHKYSYIASKEGKSDIIIEETEEE